MSALEDAVRFVRAVLADGARSAGEVTGLAATEGIRPSTLRRAVKQLEVAKSKKGPPGRDGWWEWALPEHVGASDGERSALGAREILAALVLPTGKTWGASASEVQRSDAEAILASDPPARRFWVGRPRGYSKTSDAGALTVAAVLGGIIEPGDRGFFCAADRDQARLAADAIAGWAHRSDLGGLVVVESGRVRFPKHHVEIEIMSSDAPSAWGRTGSWYVIDELPNWADVPNSRAFWEAISTSFPKVPTSRVIVIGTASSPVHFAAKIHEDALGDTRWRVSDVHTSPPWIDPAEIEGERRRLSAGSFARLWENRWVAAEDHLVTAENLARCVTLTGPWPLKPVSSVRYAISVDLGLKFDWTAISVAHCETRDGERHVVLDALEVFKPARDRQVKTKVVEGRVAELSKKYGHAPVFFDENQAIGMIQELKAKNFSVEAVPFTARSNDAMVTLLHQLLRDGLVDLPDHAELLDELLSVRVVETRQGLLSIDSAPGRHDDQTDALGLVAVQLMERSAATARFGSSADMEPMRMPRGGVDVYAETWNPLRDSEWERRSWRYER